MPRVYNTSGVKAGCIYRIKLENFVTYSKVQIFPGTSLNMIIGPNGTGKSTFVCAIILGLCGNISSIGRAKKISHYIRHGCTSASIEIELYREHKQENVTITRIFDNKEISRWYIDNKAAPQSAVSALISSLNIQVDNLCQLLPQDRVKDFAKMDPHTLLHSTLSAVGQQQQVTQLEELKKWRADQRNITEVLKKNEEKKQELIKQNERLKLRIDVINQRKEIEKKLKVCDCKILWVEESILREKAKQHQADRKKAEKVLKASRDKMKPIQKSMENVKKAIDQLENERLALNNLINQLKENSNDLLQSVKIQGDKITEEQSWYREIEEKLAAEKDRLRNAKLLLEKLKMDKAKALEQYRDESEIKLALNELLEPMNKLQREKTKLRHRKEEIQSNFESSIFPEMQRCRNKINTLQDVNKKRLQALENVSPDAKKAFDWLQRNMEKFSGPVYGPMMLEINFPDPRYARYLEARVPFRDLVAFTFSNEVDMNLFLNIVRRDMDLALVNAVCSPPGEIPQAPDIRLISKYGFQTYLVDTFTAPDMIVQYLCDNYNVHNIPIGTDYTLNNSDKVPSNIKFYFSENHRFSVRVSVYSGAKSTSISEIQPPRLLADTVNVDQINRWRQQLEPLEMQEKEYQQEKRNIDLRLSNLERQLQEYDSQRSSINGLLITVQKLSRTIHTQQCTIEELENRGETDIQKEKEKCLKRQRECVTKQVKLHQELVEEVNKLHQMYVNKQLAMVKLQMTRATIVDKEAKLRELNNHVENAQKDLEKLAQLEDRTLKLANEKLEEARRASNNKEPRSAQFPHREVYEALPEQLSELQQLRADLDARTRCMSDSDEADLQTYENNKKMIEKLVAEEASSKQKNSQLEQTMKKVKLDWRKSIEKLLSSINVRFSNMFAKLHCAGEVRLKMGTCEEDFSEYGVSILVQFRAGEQFSSLTPHTQSGGERALATALYLLALQHHAAAPFRCVDEINQGMDSTNERKMYELLVQVTTEGKQGQYFLLTPKLLTDLSYNRKIKVHTIMNGTAIESYERWQLDTFMQRAPSFRA